MNGLYRCAFTENIAYMLVGALTRLVAFIAVPEVFVAQWYVEKAQ